VNTSGSSALRRVASEPIPDGVVRVRFHKTIPTFVALRRESEGKARAEDLARSQTATTLAAAPRAGRDTA
jgi:hypothetical protein